ncbi:hypothetical protein ILUMI_20873 [Ignelater luminosus]|uniref:Uncharacterized protein n=1 Tax=Ignelater luminosus TaxID=2038154 RepID=A0A8K0CJY4_IGNLU|nr:hypothetical protein ILUMI_20873 [Ignelater luminosus]
MVESVSAEQPNQTEVQDDNKDNNDAAQVPPEDNPSERFELPCLPVQEGKGSQSDFPKEVLQMPTSEQSVEMYSNLEQESGNQVSSVTEEKDESPKDSNSTLQPVSQRKDKTDDCSTQEPMHMVEGVSAEQPSQTEAQDQNKDNKDAEQVQPVENPSERSELPHLPVQQTEDIQSDNKDQVCHVETIPVEQPQEATVQNRSQDSVDVEQVQQKEDVQSDSSKDVEAQQSSTLEQSIQMTFSMKEESNSEDVDTVDRQAPDLKKEPVKGEQSLLQDDDHVRKDTKQVPAEKSRVPHILVQEESDNQNGSPKKIEAGSSTSESNIETIGSVEQATETEVSGETERRQVPERENEPGEGFIASSETNEGASEQSSIGEEGIVYIPIQDGSRQEVVRLSLPKLDTINEETPVIEPDTLTGGATDEPRPTIDFISIRKSKKRKSDQLETNKHFKGDLKNVEIAEDSLAHEIQETECETADDIQQERTQETLECNLFKSISSNTTEQEKTETVLTEEQNASQEGDDEVEVHERGREVVQEAESSAKECVEANVQQVVESPEHKASTSKKADNQPEHHESECMPTEHQETSTLQGQVLLEHVDDDEEEPQGEGERERERTDESKQRPVWYKSKGGKKSKGKKRETSNFGDSALQQKNKADNDSRQAPEHKVKGVFLEQPAQSQESTEQNDDQDGKNTKQQRAPVKKFRELEKGTVQDRDQVDRNTENTLAHSKLSEISNLPNTEIQQEEDIGSDSSKEDKIQQPYTLEQSIKVSSSIKQESEKLVSSESAREKDSDSPSKSIVQQNQKENEDFETEHLHQVDRALGEQPAPPEVSEEVSLGTVAKDELLTDFDLPAQEGDKPDNDYKQESVETVFKEPSAQPQQEVLQDPYQHGKDDKPIAINKKRYVKLEKLPTLAESKVNFLTIKEESVVLSEYKIGGKNQLFTHSNIPSNISSEQDWPDQQEHDVETALEMHSVEHQQKARQYHDQGNRDTEHMKQEVGEQADLEVQEVESVSEVNPAEPQEVQNHDQESKDNEQVPAGGKLHKTSEYFGLQVQQEKDVKIITSKTLGHSNCLH